MGTVTIHEAKTNLSRLIAEAEAGAEIVISRGSKPVAKLVGLAPVKRRQPGMLKHLEAIPADAFAPLTDTELNEMFGTADF